MLDHRKHRVPDIDGQYAPSHTVELIEGGYLHRLVGRKSFAVNSLHSQGIDRLAGSLSVEARAPDGLIEAVRVKGCASFALAIQWHPEWHAMTDAASRAIFEAFGAACRAHAAGRTGIVETARVRSA